jgi:hypothetical protein
MADLPNLLIFLVPYTLGIIYLKCWHNFLRHEDPDHAPEECWEAQRDSAHAPGHGSLTHRHA